MAVISAWQVGSLLWSTILWEQDMMTPSRTTDAPNGPPCSRRMPTCAEEAADRIQASSAGDIRLQSHCSSHRSVPNPPAVRSTRPAATDLVFCDAGATTGQIDAASFQVCNDDKQE
mmetsp:Transcript_6213/g.9711  ORF Transcript_6213/g.9711 Transcript_6213/m.9711 type:complete len:116 (+) Transcript_6213:994-1341(+)